MEKVAWELYDLLIVGGIIFTAGTIYRTLKEVYRDESNPFEKYNNKLIESKEGGNLEGKIGKD
jgi:hypothetical protein